MLMVLILSSWSQATSAPLKCNHSSKSVPKGLLLELHVLILGGRFSQYRASTQKTLFGKSAQASDLSRSNSKCLLLKLLCTLANLYEGTPLQPLRPNSFGIDFPSHPRSQLPFITFHRQNNRTRVKARRAHERAPLPNLPTPTTFRPTPQLPLAISCLRAPFEECFP